METFSEIERRRLLAILGENRELCGLTCGKIFTAGKEEGVKDALDKISAEISSVGGNVETVQKMDRKHFARVADKSTAPAFM